MVEEEFTPGTPENKNSSTRINIGSEEEKLPSTKMKRNVINTPVSLTKRV